MKTKIFKPSITALVVASTLMISACNNKDDKKQQVLFNK